MLFCRQNALTNASRQNALKMTNDLMHGIFSTEYMASHSLAGGNKDKPALPTLVVDRIVGEFWFDPFNVCVATAI